MKRQIVVIHGGDIFATQDEYINFLRNYEINIERYKTGVDDWKPWLREILGNEYEVILPVMPNKTNARFEEWKLWFEKLLPFLNDEVILIGHSLGGSFLAKYLSENNFSKKIRGIFLVSACYGDNPPEYYQADFKLPKSL